MNKNEMAAVMLSDGPWQFKSNLPHSVWTDVFGEPKWMWATNSYRVKPKPAELFVNEYDSGMMCAHREERKAIEAFGDGSVPGKRAVRYVRASDVGLV